MEKLDLLNEYVKEALVETTNEVSMQLESDIKSELYEGHGYDTGNLKRNIRADSRIYNNYSIITGYYDEGHANYGIYVLKGVRGHGLAKTGPIDFLGDGLQKTLERYR